MDHPGLTSLASVVGRRQTHGTHEDGFLPRHALRIGTDCLVVARVSPVRGAWRWRLVNKVRGVMWWVDRWRRSTAYIDMSLEEQGAFRNLCDEVWLRVDGKIPEASLARASGDPVRWPSVRERVLQWMTPVDGGWTNDTAREVMLESLRLTETRSAAGKAGNVAKWSQTLSQTDRKPDRKSHRKAIAPEPEPYPDQGAGAGAVTTLRRDKRAARGTATSAISKSGPVWDAYSSAYEARYGTPAVRNAKVNRQLCQLVDRVGAETAPAVAAAYVAHNDPWYVRKGHPVGTLLHDAEKLHTEWARGRPITRGDARESSRADEMRAQSERVQALIDARSGE